MVSRLHQVPRHIAAHSAASHYTDLHWLHSSKMCATGGFTLSNILTWLLLGRGARRRVR
jgi:hypothetical protein